MIAYTFSMSRIELATSDGEADCLDRAISTMRDLNPGWLVTAVEWEGGEAELHGECEVCPTECVTIFEGDDTSENFHEDGDGIRLCLGCWHEHLADIEESGETE